MTSLRLLLVMLATYRATRLVTADFIGEPIRARARLIGPRAGMLASCDWCLSMWVAPIPAALSVAFPSNRLILFGLVALSASAICGLLSLLERLISPDD